MNIMTPDEIHISNDCPLTSPPHVFSTLTPHVDMSRSVRMSFCFMIRVNNSQTPPDPKLGNKKRTAVRHDHTEAQQEDMGMLISTILSTRRLFVEGSGAFSFELHGLSLARIGNSHAVKSR